MRGQDRVVRLSEVMDLLVGDAILAPLSATEAITQLGDEQKLCIRLFFYDDKSYREIATETGFTEKQVKSYLQNGKRNLRILLEKELRKHTT